MAQVHVETRELTVGQLSTRSGVAVSALHFYEAQGLISARRTSGNQRRFPREALRRVAFIRASQRVGIPLSRIKEALETLPASRTPTPRDWARLSA
ncbi:MAG TPA: redox-sensitive transcriptional activator SoxR, partial [Acidimicrobiales bacterium]|nr:redox-sensitive transcriptional activator SoxR [Acidimicrobiales bacterium]